MNQIKRPCPAFKKVLWVSLGLLLISAQPTLSAPKILVHQDVDITAIDSTYLRQIFAMQIRKWPDNQVINVYTLPSTSDLHHGFVTERLKVQPHQLDRIWNRMLFTGTGKAPTVVASEEEMVRVIQASPGAIGYVSGAYPAADVKVFQEVQP